MADAQDSSAPRRASWVSPLVLALGFVALVAAGIVTVLIPELQSQENKDNGSSSAPGANTAVDAGAFVAGDAGRP